MESNIIVLKFGSSVLRSEADLPRVVHGIYQHFRKGSQVLVVVSAFGTTTDELTRKAKNLSNEPHPPSLAALLATGEATSAALLGLAVHRAGIPARVLSPEQVGLRTAGATLDAEPLFANVEQLRKELERRVVIVSGFVGINADGDATVLGRGGSDLTALFLAQKLGGRCVLIKDVEGLYESNPKTNFPRRPRRFARARWATANAVGGGVVQPKAVNFAEKNRLNFSITALGASVETEIGGEADDFASPDTSNAKPLRVALLGCGAVGGGVYQRLAAMPEFFTITGVAVSRRDKRRVPKVPDHLITTDAARLIEQPCDAVIELIGGTDSANDFITRALDLDLHVVTANKALLAERVNRLESLAKARGAKIFYSAAVGGAMPALETFSFPEFSNKILSFSGIVNGTCNFICDELANGSDFAAAVEAAQAAGFAEADPTLDLSGADAAQKIILLARSAFGADLAFDEIRREGIEHLTAEAVQAAKDNNRVVRLVAGCYKTAENIKAVIKPLALPESHPFAQTRGAENCLQIETSGGEIKFISGAGAGRWATTEAVIADLLDLRREFAAPPSLKTRVALSGASSFSAEGGV